MIGGEHMTDKEIILNYQANVFALHSLREQIAWNQRHGQPVSDLQEQKHRLKENIIRFEDLIDSIQDRRARVILRCRFALGMTLPDVSAFMELSCYRISTITKTALARWN
jgi:DNA-directed RNA polymerase specialized sigma subunit